MQNNALWNLFQNYNLIIFLYNIFSNLMIHFLGIELWIVNVEFCKEFASEFSTDWFI